MSPNDVTRHMALLSGSVSSAATLPEAAARANAVESMRLEVIRTRVQMDINHLHQGRYGQIESSEEGLRFGTLVRMGQAEDHPVVRARYPIIRDTLMLTESRQIRNMATVGGNLLQRTRCEYFRDDFAQALIALDATVDTIGAPSGPRRIKLAELHRQPGETAHIETTLYPGELITFINVPAGPWTRRSHYIKIGDRQSYQSALVSAAVALHMEGNKVRQARVALGGVATIPWRSREAEATLKGHRLDESLAARAAKAAFAEARPSEHNAFKIPLGKRALIR